MLNGGLTIYAEFIVEMSLLTQPSGVTRRYEGMSQLATCLAVNPINMITARFNTGVTQTPRTFNWCST
jgi:hypothetical protein